MNPISYEGLALIVFGFLIGSFLNVCIYRLPQNQSVIAPASHCIVCGHALRALDLIPVISYLWQRGKCRYCGTSFSARYALVEGLTGFVFVWCFMIFGLEWQLAKALLYTSFLIVITFIDYDHQLILDKTLIWFAGAGVAINVLIGNIALLDMLAGV